MKYKTLDDSRLCLLFFCDRVKSYTLKAMFSIIALQIIAILSKLSDWRGNRLHLIAYIRSVYDVLGLAVLQHECIHHIL